MGRRSGEYSLGSRIDRDGAGGLYSEEDGGEGAGQRDAGAEESEDGGIEEGWEG